MLASILPGFREVRTPLVTGYLYLMCVWLALGQDRLLPDEPSSEFTRRLSDLFQTFGTAAAVATVSFAAYLLGALLTVRKISPRVRSILSTIRIIEGRDQTVSSRSRPGDHRARLQQRLDSLPLDIRVQLNNFVWDQVESAYGADQPQAEALARLVGLGSNFGRAVQEVLGRADHERGSGRSWVLPAALNLTIVNEFEVQVLADRLHLEREALWNEYDRLRSEAELRFSLFIPLVLVTVLATVLWSPLALFGLVLPVVLLRQGLSNQRQAESTVWQALLGGWIKSPILEKIQALDLDSINARQLEADAKAGPDPGQATGDEKPSS